jgi:hypothetical protein
VSGDIWFERTLRQYVETELAEANARIARLEAEAADWMRCARDNQEMLNTIGRQLGGQIPEQLVSEVARDCMDRIAELEAAIDKLAQCKGRYHTEANYKALIEVRNKTLHK